MIRHRHLPHELDRAATNQVLQSGQAVRTFWYRGVGALLAAALCLMACSGSSGSPELSNVGGSKPTGGASNSGDTSPTGGSKSNGGSPATGGTIAFSSGGLSRAGGTTAIGGTAAAGGTSTSATGGSNSAGGTPPTGGTSVVSTGGMKSVGGIPSTGGNVPTGGSKSVGGTVSTGGTKATGGSLATGGSPAAGGSRTNANVKITQPFQVIDGFGVSNAWLSAPDTSIRTTVYDALFSVSKGAGLSLLRNRVPFRENPSSDDQFINKTSSGAYTSTTNADGSKTFSLNWTNWDLNNTSTLISDIKAKGSDYQVTQFMSTPWTPPNNGVSRWKLSDSNHTIDYANAPEVGGYLDPKHYQDYADVLADYALGFKAKMGVDLNVLSLQNEPNFQCTYESADWSVVQFHDFIAILKTEFTKKGVFAQLPNLKIMAPEYQNVNDSLVLATLNDTNTASVIGTVGVHQYEFGTDNVSTYTPPLLTNSINAGKHVWMTEWSTAAWADSAAIADGLILARLVHMDLTSAGMSAFNYWWTWGSGNGVLVVINGTTVTVPKRLYALGQYSRFVRPGWVRVGTTVNPATNVYLSAFKNATGSQVAIVAVNTGASQVQLPLTVDSGQFGTLTQYRTSSSENIANVGTLTAGPTVTATLTASSITTFAGALTP